MKIKTYTFIYNYNDMFIIINISLLKYKQSFKCSLI